MDIKPFVKKTSLILENRSGIDEAALPFEVLKKMSDEEVCKLLEEKHGISLETDFYDKPYDGKKYTKELLRKIILMRLECVDWAQIGVFIDKYFEGKPFDTFGNVDHVASFQNTYSGFISDKVVKTIEYNFQDWRFYITRLYDTYKDKKFKKIIYFLLEDYFKKTGKHIEIQDFFKKLPTIIVKNKERDFTSVCIFLYDRLTLTKDDLGNKYTEMDRKTLGVSVNHYFSDEVRKVLYGK